MTRLERRRLWLDRRLAEADAAIYGMMNSDDAAPEGKHRWRRHACCIQRSLTPRRPR